MLKNEQHFLVIDDDYQFAHLLKFLLHKEMPHLVIDLLHSPQQIAHVDLDRYDMVLVDLLMPEKDGIDTSYRIREKSNIPLILLTSAPQDPRCQKIQHSLRPIFILPKSKNILGTVNAIKNLKQNADMLLGMEKNLRETRIINEAKGYLRGLLHLDTVQANNLLKKISSHKKLKLFEISKQLLAGEIGLKYIDSL